MRPRQQPCPAQPSNPPPGCLPGSCIVPSLLACISDQGGAECAPPFERLASTTPPPPSAAVCACDAAACRVAWGAKPLGSGAPTPSHKSLSTPASSRSFVRTSSSARSADPIRTLFVGSAASAASSPSPASSDATGGAPLPAASATISLRHNGSKTRAAGGLGGADDGAGHAFAKPVVRTLFADGDPAGDSGDAGEAVLRRLLAHAVCIGVSRRSMLDARSSARSCCAQRMLPVCGACWCTPTNCVMMTQHWRALQPRYPRWHVWHVCRRACQRRAGARRGAAGRHPSKHGRGGLRRRTGGILRRQ